MLRILITGGAGFMGRALRAEFSKSGFEVHYTVRPGRAARSAPLGDTPPGTAHELDLTDPDKVSEAIAGIAPDTIVHLAALARPNRSLEDFDRQYQNTIQPAVTLARAVPESVRMTFFVGSIEEYGANPPPFTEDQLPDVLSPYGWGKSAAMEAVRYIAKLRKIPYSWLRPSLTFGPGQHYDALIPSLIRRCLAGQAIDLTLGEQTRDLIFTGDLARMFLKLIRDPAPAQGRILNLCTGREVRVRDLAEEIQRQCGAGEIRLGAIPYRAHEAMRFFGSTRLWDQLYGKMEFTDWREALALTIAADRVDRQSARSVR